VGQAGDILTAVGELPIAAGTTVEAVCAHIAAAPRPLTLTLSSSRQPPSSSSSSSSAAGESKRLVVEWPWAQLTSECQRF
jgi:hypothetical protein